MPILHKITLSINQYLSSQFLRKISKSTYNVLKKGPPTKQMSPLQINSVGNKTTLILLTLVSGSGVGVHSALASLSDNPVDSPILKQSKSVLKNFNGNQW